MYPMQSSLTRLVRMQIHTSRCLSSVYQLMRPVNSDMTLLSGDRHKSSEEEETQSLFILLRAHANQPLVPFQRRNMKISISATRYELVCFFLPSSFVGVLCWSITSGYDKRLLTCEGVLSSVLCCASSVLFLPHTKGDKITIPFILHT